MMQNELKRRKSTYAFCIFSVILLGLFSRSQLPVIPALVREYAGDTFYALAAYLTIAFLFPRLSIRRVAIFAALFCLAVEISQLYHAFWIDRIRQIRIGGLLLGHGFLWSDLICYFVGVNVGVLLELCRICQGFSKYQNKKAL
jgi:glycopeptide antibiotics resistance protein